MNVAVAFPGQGSQRVGAGRAPGAVAILERRAIASAEDPDAVRLELEEEYRMTYCTPRIAAERGYVDQIIDPTQTRAHVAAAVVRPHHKRMPQPHRRHATSPQ